MKRRATFVKIYSAVTTENIWKFLKYEAGIAYIDIPECHIANAGKILGILMSMVNQTA